MAVVMHKGWRQVAAVLGIHRAGCAYVPIDASLPRSRIDHLVSVSGAVAVVTSDDVLESHMWLEQEGLCELGCVNVDAVDGFSVGRVVEEAEFRSMVDQALMGRQRVARDVAYIIYTSGSTGVPKGVVCHHQGANNTIDDPKKPICGGVKLDAPGCAGFVHSGTH